MKLACSLSTECILGLVLVASGAAGLFAQNIPTLSADPPSMQFSYQLGMAPPPTRLLSVTSGGMPVAFHAAVSSTSGGDWLTVSPSLDGITPANLAVLLNPTAIQMIPPGTYSGAITLTASGVTNSGLRVPVDLMVTGVTTPTPPVIASISPDSATAGGPAFMLTVNGSGFVAASAVRWNGSPLSTSYISATQLTAAVPANVLGSAGGPSITVANPDGTTSNAVQFTIRASTSTSSLSIITRTPLPAGTVGVAYSQTLAASGGVLPYKGWAATGGTLPPGITVSTPPSSQVGLVSGTPTTAGTYSFAIQVTDAANATASMQYSLTINPGGSTGISIASSGIVNAASYGGGSVAPGEILVVSGTGFGPGSLVTLQLDSKNYVSTTLAGVQLLFDGVAAPLLYVQSGTVSGVVPYSVSGKTSTQVQISSNGQMSNSVSVPVTAVAPGVFTMDQSGRGPGAVVNGDGTLNSAKNPAAVGSYVSVYATGEGQTIQGGIDGKPADLQPPTPVQIVTAAISGINATVQYAGGAPGLVAGVSQINIQIPQGIPTNGAAPLVLMFGGQASQSGVTLAVK